ncbi:AfsR/SARP family transcriptional regulator [Streptomyces xiaopingdaonensis]|uniref:AfsR/SARP family transcriptional regulator n=1 Tax=Streptomyces xiaopingdaonensis TaxID=1565415 RepID=UPI00035F01B3|nr:AfsR/SARP family transcriptional regulator [Streptomyces xiaopingdaonensis]
MGNETRVRFRILGSFECWDGEERLRVGGPVHERVLVTLLLDPGRVLPVPRLVEAVWGEEAPATAEHQVRKAVADLRRRLPDGRSVIVTDGPGYRAVVTEEQLDLSQFNEGLRRAREATADGRTRRAAEALRDSLALWRGPVLSGAGGEVIVAASAAVEERRLTALEQSFQLRLGFGESGELIGDLRELISAHPLRERVRGQLMLALYRSGRQAEALEEFNRVRDLLVEELGIGPGEELQELHQGILRNSPELAAPAPAEEPPGPAPLVVEETRTTLPYDLPDFAGRNEELGRILGFVDEPTGSGPLIVMVDGMGGSGKTSLAVRAAHQLAAHYTDAQLYLDLRGFAPGEQPLSAFAATEALLRMLGAPAERIPEDLDGRTALWRQTATRHRMLLLLDNAVDEAQIRPLLTPSSDVLTLITSRSLLVDLDGAHSVSLGTMSPQDSTALVVAVLGAARAEAEPEAVAELTSLCGHLPLALRIAAARLRKRPRWTVRYLVDRLRDDTHRLAELNAGERSVEVTLRLSYEGLEAGHRKAFRLLGQYPGPELDVHTAAALLDAPTRDAEDTLEYLLDVHLMQQQEPGRYAFHDLVRSFALGLLRPADEDDEAEGAVVRLLDYCQLATDAACDLLFPGRVRTEGPQQEVHRELPALHSAVRAREWLEREQDGLLAAVALAYRRGMDRRVARLAANIVFQLDLRGRFDDFQELAGTAVDASRRLGDRPLLRLSLSNLAVAHWKLGRFEEGVAEAEEALQLAVELRDQRGEAKDTGLLGLLFSALGRFDEAAPRLEQSIALKRELGAERAEAESLTNLSALYAQRGRFADAAEAAERAVALDRRIGATDKEVEALTDLAVAKLGLGEEREAYRVLARARELASDAVSPAEGALLLAVSAEASERLGESEEAERRAGAALHQARLSGAPLRQAAVANTLGRLHRRRGGHVRALELHRQAHRHASESGYRVEEAHALHGIAAALRGLGDDHEAERYRTRAEEAFETMGVPEECRG